MKKGFTLVELLAVIALLGLIAVITMFSIGNIISNSEESLSESQKKSVENAAKIYYLEEGMTKNITCVNIETLIQNGYIDAAEVKDPKTRKEMKGSVLITETASNYLYKYTKNTCE